MRNIALMVFLAFALAGCSEIQLASHIWKSNSGYEGGMASTTPSQGTFKVGKPYRVGGQTYYPKESYDLVETGIASWYGPGFHGRKTASGEIYDSNALTAAHRTLQLPSMVRVTNLENGRSIIVRVNDRGPYARGRIIDVSKRAADLLGFLNKGTAKVRLQVLTQQSLKIAEMAKRGESTQGTAVAANQGRLMPPEASPAPVQTETLAAADTPVHLAANGKLVADPVVTQMPVSPSSIYIQVGSFTVYGNATKLRQALAGFSNVGIQEAQVRGRKFFRVRIGPVPDVDHADAMLGRVVAKGYGRAIIVVD